MPITKGSRQLVEEASAQITTYTVEQVRVRMGCINAPRGMLEFWVDPASPYFKPIFGDEGKEFVLFCGAGWRSALTAKSLQDMGMTNVAHIEGGFADWVKQAAPIETLEERKARKA